VSSTPLHSDLHDGAEIMLAYLTLQDTYWYLKVSVRNRKVRHYLLPRSQTRLQLWHWFEFGFRPENSNFVRISPISVRTGKIISQTKSTKFWGFFFWFFIKSQPFVKNFLEIQILDQIWSNSLSRFKFCFSIFVRDLTEKYRNGRISSISVRAGKFLKTKFKMHFWKRNLKFLRNLKMHILKFLRN
jgi:hypothetical protein